MLIHMCSANVEIHLASTRALMGLEGENGQQNIHHATRGAIRDMLRVKTCFRTPGCPGIVRPLPRRWCWSALLFVHQVQALCIHSSSWGPHPHLHHFWLLVLFIPLPPPPGTLACCVKTEHHITLKSPKDEQMI